MLKTLTRIFIWAPFVAGPETPQSPQRPVDPAIPGPTSGTAHARRRPMGPEHPSLATAVRDELNLASALGHEGAHLIEIRHVPHVSPVDRSASAHATPILQLRIVVRGEAASDHVTRTADIEWTGVS